VGANSHDLRAVGPALAILRSGRYPFAEMITHRLPLEEARRAIDLIGDRTAQAVKVLVDPS
jgi:alcohol dehydrogenase